MAASSDSTSTTTVLYVVVVVVAVLVATVLAPIVWSAASGSDDSDRSSVAVVTFRGGVNDQTANAISEDLREARNNDSVEAVVLRIDSPGGGVAASEELYYAVNRTAQEMPVVAYVEGSAASGGYYTIAPADSIVVKPSSQVGSIGVVVQAPMSSLEQADEQSEVYIRSGPDKAQIDKDNFLEEMESLQNAFGNTVMYHRGDEFEVDRETVLSGKAWLGTEAVENGFADRVGSLETAIQLRRPLQTGTPAQHRDHPRTGRDRGRESRRERRLRRPRDRYRVRPAGQVLLHLGDPRRHGRRRGGDHQCK
jgi:protease-4